MNGYRYLGKNIYVGDDVFIDPTAHLETSDGIFIGSRSHIGAYARVEGRHILMGQECWLDQYSMIGGGSCNSFESALYAGDWLHMGMYSQINIAKKVTIGHECGVGIGTRIFTHGAYLSVYDGFPVQWGDVTIGDRVWLPQATVLPGVSIGSNVVVAAGSLVNSSLPEGCLAGGTPARIIKANEYPGTPDDGNLGRLRRSIEEIALYVHDCKLMILEDMSVIEIYIGDRDATRFDIETRRITGRVNPVSEAVKNQLRRNGVRFRYLAKDGVYVPWDKL